MQNNNKKRVLLVNPPGELQNPVLPLGLALIAAYLRDKDIDVQVIDAWAEKMGFDDLQDKVSQTNADIIGVYMTSPHYNKAKDACEACRKALPNSIIIAGGAHPSALPVETLKDIPQLDICAVGEGEITMYDLVKSFQENGELSAIDGIAFRDKNNNEIIVTKLRDFIQNLDELPFPARDLFPIKKYKALPPYGRKNPYFTVITSRGCSFQCSFCSKDVFRDKFRARSPKNVCDEIEELISKYNAQEIHFYDDDFTLDMKRAEEICDEIIRRGIKFRWSCITRVNLVNENLLRKMKEAGCWMIGYGVESGNQGILNTIGKGINIEQIISAFEMSKRVGLTTSGGFIAGLPGETRETIKDSLDLAKKLKLDFFSYGILTIYPGSRLYKAIQRGEYAGKLRILKDDDLSGTYPRRGSFMIIEENLPLEELRKIIKKANIEFYLRPQYIWQCLKSIRSVSDFQYYFLAGLNIVKSLMG